MYTKDDLLSHDFFKDFILKNEISEALDEQTGIINKNTFKKLVNYEIANNKKFAMSYLEIDSFKSIIESYGDDIATKVINDISKNLSIFFHDKGLVARLDGEKFGIIIYDLIEYNDIHTTFQELMHNGKVLRKNVHCGIYSPYVTATAGVATYPNDASTFEEIEDKVLKTLYRGKIKGRNCFIIWVYEKHKDIVINPLYKETFDVKVKKLFQMFESKVLYSVSGDDIPYVFNYVRDDINVEYLLYIDKDFKVYDSTTTDVLGKIKNIDDKFTNDELIIDYKNDTKNVSEELYYIFDDLGIQSSYLLRMESNENFYGYFLLASKRVARIWDPKEKIMLFLLSKLYSRYLNEHKIVGIKKFSVKVKGM